MVFDDLKFKDDFTDWVIVLDLTFRQATHQRTNEILSIMSKTLTRFFPKARQLLAVGSKRSGVGDAFG